MYHKAKQDNWNKVADAALTLVNDARYELVFLMGLDTDALPTITEAGAVVDCLLPFVLLMPVMKPREVVVAVSRPVVHLGHGREVMLGQQEELFPAST